MGMNTELYNEVFDQFESLSDSIECADSENDRYAAIRYTREFNKLKNDYPEVFNDWTEYQNEKFQEVYRSIIA